MNRYKIWLPAFEDKKAQISTIQHPSYNPTQYEKFRLTFAGGAAFVEKYLQKFSKRETDTDYADRKAVTYVPAFAKAAVIDIKNSIFNRMTDVRRLNGDPTYQLAVKGKGAGVDRQSNSMNSFIGSQVLPELLPIGKVAIAVDKPDVRAETLADEVGLTPYLYIYKAEQIRSWSYDAGGHLTTLLVEAQTETIDNEYGLVDGYAKEYRLFRLGAGNVIVDTFDSDSKSTGTKTLELPMIPIVISELTHSLLVDVCDYQIAHMNLASSDISYALKGNFPFYTEQYDPLAETRMRTVGQEADGTEADSKVAKSKEISAGVVHGRQYSKGVERPDFIAPPSDPMRISMEKQDVLKKEIRQLVNLAVANMDPARESAESKKLDAQGLDAGLSYIGLELERIETRIAEIWGAYTSSEPATVKYPEDYSLQSTSERLTRAKEYNEMIPSSPSKTFQRELTKLVADTLLGNRISADELEEIHSEIDEADIVYVDPKTLHADVEMGIASAATVSLIRGYDEGEAELAMVDKARRAALIVAQQSKAAQGTDNPAARGVPELDPNPNSAQEEKKRSQNRDNNIDQSNGKRGKA